MFYASVTQFLHTDLDTGESPCLPFKVEGLADVFGAAAAARELFTVGGQLTGDGFE